MKALLLKIVVAVVASGLVIAGLRIQDPEEQPRPPKKFGHDNPITRHGALVWGPHGVVHDMAYYEVTGKAYQAGLAMR